MARTIAVLGCGAIGSSVSADLTQAGYDPTVIDQWPAQVEALKANGISITMPDGEVKTPIRALHLCDLASANLEFDIVFLAVKSNDDRWLAEFIRPYLKPDGVLVGDAERHERRHARLHPRARARRRLRDGAVGGDLHARPRQA